MGIIDIKKRRVLDGVYIPEIDVYLPKAKVTLVSDSSGRRENVRIEGQKSGASETIAYYYFSTMVNPNKAERLYNLFN